MHSPWTFIGITLIALAIALALIPGGLIFLLPLSLLSVGVFVAYQVVRRSQRTKEMEEFREQAQAQKPDFTARDRETQA